MLLSRGNPDASYDAQEFVCPPGVTYDGRRPLRVIALPGSRTLAAEAPSNRRQGTKVLLIFAGTILTGLGALGVTAAAQDYRKTQSPLDSLGGTVAGIVGAGGIAMIVVGLALPSDRWSLTEPRAALPGGPRGLRVAMRF